MMSMYGDAWSDMARLQRELDQLFRPAGSGIRSMARQQFPLINVGSTPEAIEVLALAPGLAPDQLEVQVDKGMLVIAGERKSDVPAPPEAQRGNVYAQERFVGRFKRVISLPDDVDAQQVQAQCKDGLLRIRVPRHEAARPRRVQVQ